jgi:hypothetical protein
MRGLTILGYVPQSLTLLGKREPLISKIKRVLAKGAEDASTDAVKDILAKLLSLGVSAIAT